MVNPRSIPMELLLQWFLLSSFETCRVVFSCREVLKFFSHFKQIVSQAKESCFFYSSKKMLRQKKYLRGICPLSIICGLHKSPQIELYKSPLFLYCNLLIRFLEERNYTAEKKVIKNWEVVAPLNQSGKSKLLFFLFSNYWVSQTNKQTANNKVIN